MQMTQSYWRYIVARAARYDVQGLVYRMISQLDVPSRYATAPQFESEHSSHRAGQWHVRHNKRRISSKVGEKGGPLKREYTWSQKTGMRMCAPCNFHPGASMYVVHLPEGGLSRREASPRLPRR